jgi:NDP-sugar pyrophosphorylase family protein
MKQAQNLAELDVVVLCGGKGARLQKIVNDRPKPMADIGGRPFLDLLIGYLARYGFKRFILCAGYKGNIIKRHYLDPAGKLDISVLCENKPLGTAGAVKNAQGAVKSRDLS